ncbi:MAG TPA: hypothetical protein PKV43_07095, partial [Armatimonadota bacterium]|nr:hypothetical protein [Armatimonadota bacterium]
ADDFDGTVVEEKITHRAGAETPEALTVTDIRRMIEETGTVPVERDTVYREVVRSEKRVKCGVRSAECGMQIGRLRNTQRILTEQ